MTSFLLRPLPDEELTRGWSRMAIFALLAPLLALSS